jgi:subtilase family serine protease
MRRQVSFACYLLAAFASLWLLAVSSAQAESVRPLLITQSIDESKLVTLAGNTRPEAKAKNDRGAVADSLVMEHMMLLLKRSPEQERELDQLIEELHDKSSPHFHQWLKAKELGDRFGVANQDRATIKNWLQSHGFKVNVDYPNGVMLDFSGTAGQIREAFHTEIHNLDVKGEKHIANVNDPKIPAALAAAVAGVVTLNDFKPHTMYKPRVQYTGGDTCLFGQCYLVVPGDLAEIYNLNPLFTEGITGQGQTIVVLEDTDVYTTADWASFRSTFGLSGYSQGSFTQIHPAPPTGTNNCTDPGVNGDDTEAILDAEYSSAAAPNAAIVLASCADTAAFGGQIALLNLLNESSSPPAIVSMSYGECEEQSGASLNASFNTTFQQAATEGVSVFVSSGDADADGCDRGRVNDIHGISVTGWGETPYNVSVGGTDYADTYEKENSTYWSATNSPTYESALSYVPEIPWNDSCASVLLSLYEGFSEPYGTSGFCNSSEAQQFLGPAGGSGGPSECATGSPSIPLEVSGTCAGYAKPSYQSLVGNPSDGVRDIPDVSLFAANGVWDHYYPYCFSGPKGVACTEPPDEWPGAGGTSFSSPIMAGIQALVNQKAGDRQGQPNYVYYSLAAAEYGASGNSACSSTLGNKVGSSCVFYDVTLGDNDSNCTGTVNCYLPSGTRGVLSTSDTADQPAYAAQTGWDFATGIGTVNAYNLVNAWPASGPNFSLSASPSSVTITQGSNGTSTITVTPVGGFSGKVTLSASGLPSGVTAAFNPNPTSSTSTLTLTASASAAAGTVTVTITGTSGSLTNSTTISLTVQSSVQSFTLSASPKTVAIAKGGASGTSTITITPVNGFSGNVTLAATGLPKGVTASFSPNPATSTSVLTLTASKTAKVGTVTVTITGTSGSLSATTTISLTVSALGSYTLKASPTTLSVEQGSSGTSTITVNPTNGFDQEVTLAATGMPTGITATFGTNPTTSTSVLTLAVSGSAATGKSTITITGTFGTLSKKATVHLTVTKP